MSSQLINQLFTIERSYQSLLTPQLTNNLVAIVSPYHSSLTSQLTNNLVEIGSSLQSSLTRQSTLILITIGSSFWCLLTSQLARNFLKSRILVRARWYSNGTINFLWLGAPIRVHWLPKQPTNFLQFDWEVLSELIYCQLIHKLLEIGFSFQSSVNSHLTNKSLAIRKSYQSLLTFGSS